MAKTPRFIDFSELSDDLKHFIQAGAKIFPIETYEDLPTTKVYEFYRVLNGEYRNHIFAWYESIGEYKLIGADDKDVTWDDVKYKPTTFPPTTHTHDYAGTVHGHTTSDISDYPETFPPSEHGHTELHTHDNKTIIDTITQTLIDRWNSAWHHIIDTIKHITSEERTLWNTVSNKVDTEVGKGLSTNDFTDIDKSKLDSLTETATLDYEGMQQELEFHKTSADHDGRYNTKTEITNLLSSKANKSIVDGHINSSTIHVTQTNKDTWNSKAEGAHAHVELDITDLDKYTQAEVNSLLSGKANITDIPTNVSELTNDSGYLTAHQDISYKADITYVDEQVGGIAGVEVVTTEPIDIKAGQVIFLEVT